MLRSEVFPTQRAPRNAECLRLQSYKNKSDSSSDGLGNLDWSQIWRTGVPARHFFGRY